MGIAVTLLHLRKCKRRTRMEKTTMAIRIRSERTMMERRTKIERRTGMKRMLRSSEWLHC